MFIQPSLGMKLPTDYFPSELKPPTSKVLPCLHGAVAGRELLLST